MQTTLKKPLETFIAEQVKNGNVISEQWAYTQLSYILEQQEIARSISMSKQEFKEGKAIAFTPELINNLRKRVISSVK